MPVFYSTRRPSKVVLKILKNRIFWACLAAILFLGVAAIGGRWAHGKWTNRQSWKLAGIAEQQAREGQTNEALMSLETALRLRPDNPSALRQLARLRTSLGQRQEALAAWQKLSEANALTADDAQNYALLAGLDGEWALANLIIDQFRAGN
ncbi:MAG: tetratricopeptide repeat protein, partial [Verrucomicrobiota bacterium]